jgi:hypothetical protein
MFNGELKGMKILVGTPIHRQGAFALDKFLANQKHIHQNYSDCSLVFSTEDKRYVDELNLLIQKWQIKGVVISHGVEKPLYAKDRIWNISSARESIRRHFLTNPEASYLLFIDADMTCHADVINILLKEISGYDVVFSGYRFRNGRIGLAGTGCLLLTRQALEKISFRCYEFKNGQVINEDNILEMDLFRQGLRIKKGFFLAIDHYYSHVESKHIDPRKVGFLRTLTTSSFIRYCLIRVSIALHCNIPAIGQNFLWSFLNVLDRIQGKNN